MKRADSCTCERGGGAKAEGLSASRALRERGVGGNDVYWESSFGGAPKVDTLEGIDDIGGTENASLLFDELSSDPAKKEELGGGYESSSRNDDGFDFVAE